MDSIDVIDVAGDACSGPVYCRPGLVLRLIIFYFLIAFLCWNEVRFRYWSIEIPGQVVSVEPAPKHRRQRVDRFNVRFQYQDPISQRQMSPEVTLLEKNLPQSKDVIVQLILSDSPQSRLKSQENKSYIWLFMGVNGMLAGWCLLVIGYVVWLYHHKPDRHLSPKERGLARYQRRRKLESSMHG